MNQMILDSNLVSEHAALLQATRLAEKLEEGSIALDSQGDVFDLSEDGQPHLGERFIATGDKLYNPDMKWTLDCLNADAGTPTGSLTVITPKPIRQRFPQYQFCWGLVPDPPDSINAAGANDIESTIVQYTGGSRPVAPNHDSRRGQVDISLKTVNYKNRRFGGYYTVSHYRAEQLNLMLRQSMSLSAINYLLELRKSAEYDYYEKCNLAFGLGLDGVRLVGMLNNPFVPLIITSTSLNTISGATAPDDFLALLLDLDQAILENSDRVWTGTTLLLGPKARSNASGLYFSGVNQNVLTRFEESAAIAQKGFTYPDGSPRPMEIREAPELEDISTTFDYAVIYNRTPEALVKRAPMPMTYRNPVPTTEGYDVAYDFELSGTHFNHPLSAAYLQFPKS